jgi:hypothetical protein
MKGSPLLLVVLQSMKHVPRLVWRWLRRWLHPEPSASTTFHEAGHAVLAMAQGLKVRRVSVRGGLYEDGRTEIIEKWPQDRPDFNPLDPRDRRIATRWIIVTLAGHVAEEHLIGSRRDTEWGDESDTERAWELIERLFDDPGERNAFLRRMEAKTWALVLDPLRWRQIEAVAGQLARLRELDGEQVARIMKDAVGKPAPGRPDGER